MTIKKITPTAFAALEQGGQAADLIDVRTASEFESVHAQGARNVPLDEITIDCLNPDRTAYIICHSGARAMKACKKLIAKGKDKVVCIEGGTQAWQASNLPVVRGRQMMPLDRQLQIVLGLLIVTGVVLGFMVSRWCFLISGFVGCGLLMAGVTGLCPMAILIAKAPWNRCASGQKAKCCVGK